MSSAIIKFALVALLIAASTVSAGNSFGLIVKYGKKVLAGAGLQGLKCLACREMVAYATRSPAELYRLTRRGLAFCASIPKLVRSDCRDAMAESSARAALCIHFAGRCDVCDGVCGLGKVAESLKNLVPGL